MKKYIQSLIDESISCKNKIYEQIDYIEDVSKAIINCYNKNNKILIFGNGGSAADAQHIAGELVGKFKLERKSLSAITLPTNMSVVTAWSNDYDYGTCLEREVEAHARKGDVLWGISTSGNSPNVLRAFEKGRDIGTLNISLTGNKGGELKLISDLNVNVYSKNTPRIQEAHMLIYHIVCEMVEEEMAKKMKC